jgi:hypothetical protein
MLRAVLVAALVVHAGCNSVKCGPGTFKMGDNCVGYDPNDHTPPNTTITPPGIRSRAPLPQLVMLQTDEPATIYYTTDGSDPDPTTAMGHRDQATIANITQDETIKFFAIDLAGNQEAIQSAKYESDTTPPAPPSNLAVTINGSTAHVTWTPPGDADYAGTVLARVADLVDAAPTPGQLYPAPTQLSPSVQMVSVGATTQYDDTGLAPGTVRYIAWSYDDLGNYSTPVGVTADLPVGSLTATLTYNTGNNTLTIAQSPAHLDLTGTTAAVNAGTLAVSLVVKNNTNKFFMNPKAEVTSVTNATFASSDGTADTFAFRSLGPNSFAPGATVTRALQFSTPTATVTINLTFATHASMISTYGSRGRSTSVGLIDVGANAQLTPLTLTAPGANDRGVGRPRATALVAGHYLYVATTHAIEQYDLASGMHLAAVQPATANLANTQYLISTGADLIAVLKYADTRGGGMLELVRLDEKLNVTARQTITKFSDDRGAGQPGLSADRSTLALPLAGGVLLVDTRTLALIDADPSTPEVELVSTGLDKAGRLGSVVFYNGTNGMLVLAKKTGQVAAITKTGTTWNATTVYSDGTTSQGGFSAVMGPDGKIWMAFPASLRTFDPATGIVAQVGAYTQATNGLGVVDGQLWVVRSDRMTLDQISTAGATVRTIVQPGGGTYGHWLGTAK